MPTDLPTGTVSEERQKALETNVFVSADQAAKQTALLQRIADDVSVVKWAALAGALFFLLLLIR